MTVVIDTVHLLKKMDHNPRSKGELSKNKDCTEMMTHIAVSIVPLRVMLGRGKNLAFTKINLRLLSS